MTIGLRARAEAVPTRHKDGFRRSAAGSACGTAVGREHHGPEMHELAPPKPLGRECTSTTAVSF